MRSRPRLAVTPAAVASLDRNDLAMNSFLSLFGPQDRSRSCLSLVTLAAITAVSSVSESSSHLSTGLMAVAAWSLVTPASSNPLRNAVAKARLQLGAGELEAGQIVVLGLGRNAQRLPELLDVLGRGIGLGPADQFLGRHAELGLCLLVRLGGIGKCLLGIVELPALVVGNTEQVRIETRVPGRCRCCGATSGSPSGPSGRGGRAACGGGCGSSSAIFTLLR